MKTIPLSLGLETIVDDETYVWATAYAWHATGSKGKYYASTKHQGRKLLLHRLIMNPAPGLLVDHINGNSLDNRIVNLRFWRRGRALVFARFTPSFRTRDISAARSALVIDDQRDSAARFC